jgi:phosphatidylethanolamine/phosphatidyl-N-methylethanolamine N-methyltransferase
MSDGGCEPASGSVPELLGWLAMNAAHALFFREFLRNPLRTAAVLPSSKRVARQIAAAVPAEDDPVVVELGPGTGAFTTEIQRRLRGRGLHLAVELNDRFAAVLRDRFPDVDVAVGDAAHLRRLLDERGVDYPGTIISGLPHSLVPRAVQRGLMGAIRDCLAPDGRFVAFSYVHTAWSPAERHFFRLLDAMFADIAIGEVVWRNLPPAFVYTARHLMFQPQVRTRRLEIPGRGVR